ACRLLSSSVTSKKLVTGLDRRGYLPDGEDIRKFSATFAFPVSVSVGPDIRDTACYVFFHATFIKNPVTNPHCSPG
ncbi:TPA: hypothetical protein ACSP0P_004644, partial [Citrobacter freundii]